MLRRVEPSTHSDPLTLIRSCIRSMPADFHRWDIHTPRSPNDRHLLSSATFICPPLFSRTRLAVNTILDTRYSTAAMIRSYQCDGQIPSTTKHGLHGLRTHLISLSRQCIVLNARPRHCRLKLKRWLARTWGKCFVQPTVSSMSRIYM